MIFEIMYFLIGTPHKTLINGNLFDFTKIRVNISLCVSEKFVFNHFQNGLFLVNLL